MGNNVPGRKKWLILGAGGQLGREWSKQLERDGCDYLAPARDRLDITDSGQVRRILDEYRPDIVINAAAYTAVDRAEDERKRAEAINSDAPGQLAGICTEMDTQLIHYSTDYIFPGRLADRKQFPDGYPEMFPAEPVNWYGRTKWLGEEKVRAAGGTHLILRVSWLCGAYGNNFVKTMLRLAGEKDQLKVVNDQWGCPSFTAPTVFNTRALISRQAYGTFHLTSQGEITWYDFARAVLEIKQIGVDIEPVTTEEFPTRAGRPAWSKLDIRKLADIPGTRILPWREELGKLLSRLPA